MDIYTNGNFVGIHKETEMKSHYESLNRGKYTIYMNIYKSRDFVCKRFKGNGVYVSTSFLAKAIRLLLTLSLPMCLTARC